MQQRKDDVEMKHFRSKRFTLSLFALLLLSVLTACQMGGEKEGSTTTPAQQPKTEAPAVGGDQAAASIDPDEPAWKLDTSPITLSWFVGASWYAHSWGESLASKYVSEKTGVNVKLEVPSGDANEQMTLMMTSGQLPDLISMG